MHDAVICGNCVDVMGSMPDECIDLVVTSPPYDNLRTYNGYSFDFENVAKELFRIIKPGGVVVWVVGDATVDGSESGTSFRQALFFKEIGFNLHDTMIYHKRGLPCDTVKRYRQDFEYMFVVSKGQPKTFNPLMHKRVYDDKRAEKVFNKNKMGTHKKSKTNPKDMTKDGNIFFYVASGGNGQTDEIAYNHPATYPEKLAEDQIASWSNPGDLVLDPFCGSGTTLKMAHILDRKYIGIDISEEYCEISRYRVNEQRNQTRLKAWFGEKEEEVCV